MEYTAYQGRNISKMSAPMPSLIVKWSGQEYVISDLSERETVADLKEAIKKQTGVMPARQKLLGLKLKGIFCS